MQLAVPYFSQRDNFTQASRTCNSSACAMCLEYFKPDAIANDCDYLEQVLATGDSTDHDVQTQVLERYGLKSEFRYDLGYADLDASLAANKPVVIGFYHTGTIWQPTGGHMAVVIGKWENGYILNDPWGDLNDGYQTHNGEARYYSYRSLNARWLDVSGDRALPLPNQSGWGRVF